MIKDIDDGEFDTRFGFDALPNLKIFHGYGKSRGTASVVSEPKLRKARHWRGVPHPMTDALEFQLPEPALEAPTSPAAPR